MGTISRAMACSAILLTGACSTTPYVQQVSKFGTSILDVSEVHRAMVQGERDDLLRLNRTKVLAGGSRFDYSDGCNALRGPAGINCGFDVVSPPLRSTPGINRLLAIQQAAAAGATAPLSSAPTAERPEEVELDLPPDVCLEAGTSPLLVPVRASTVVAGVGARRSGPRGTGPRVATEAEIFARLAEYGDALKAVSDASDRVAFNAATDRLASAAGTLVGTLGAFAGGAGAAVGPIVTVAVKLGAFFTARALEHDRYVSLRTALVESCLSVRVLSAAGGTLIGAHRRNRLALNQDTLRIAKPGIDGFAPRRGAFFELAQQAAASTNALRGDPIATGKAMADAHDRLVVAVRSAEGQMAVVSAAVSEFADLAKELRDSVREPAGSAGAAAAATDS